MLLAVTEDNRPLIADKKLPKNKKYYCPSCKNRVYLKKGQVMRPHFAHYKKDSCSAFTEGESEEHIRGKLDLAKFFKQQDYLVSIEAYLPELKQRPDLLIEKNKVKIAIEFQCSPITIKKIVERTDGYHKVGYKVIWILGSHFCFHYSLTNLQKVSLYYSSEKDNYLLFRYDTRSRELIVHHDFQLDAYGNMHSQKYSLRISNYEKNNFKRNKVQIRERKVADIIISSHRQLTRNIRNPSVEIYTFLSLLYQEQENIVSIPVEIYSRLAHEWMIQTYHMNWKFRLLIWIESHSLREIITRNSLLIWLNERIERDEIIYSLVPGIGYEQLLKPHYEFLDSLVESKVVKKLSSHKWSYQQPAKRFKNLEDKFIHK